VNNTHIHWQLAADTPIAIAVSGGPDSMALLHLAQRYFTHITALTVDHQLRPESNAEAQQVNQWCSTLGIPHHILCWQHEAIHSGMPEKARDARYALMQDWCLRHDILHLFTAHHANDQIETIIFRLLRKSHLEGLAGILPVSSRNAMTLHRPLLNCFKEELLEWLSKEQIPYLTDPTNSSLRYSRNALRVSLSTLPHAQKKRIIQLSNYLHNFRNQLEYKLAESLNLCFAFEQAGYGTLKKSAFLSQPAELQPRMVQIICQHISGNHSPVRSEKIHRLTDALKDSSPPKKHTLHGTVFTPLPDKSGWLVLREKQKIVTRQPLRTGAQCWDGRFLVTYHGQAKNDVFIGALGTPPKHLRPALEKSAIPKSVWPTVFAVFALEECIAIPHINNNVDKLRISSINPLEKERFFTTHTTTPF
jgi:tRNA(Ile)-lysidine synthase